MARPIWSLVLAALLAACASAPPQGPAPYVVALRLTSADRGAGPGTLPLQVHDQRNQADATRVGEVLAPGGGYLPPMGGAGGSPAAGVAVAIVLLAATLPTGQYLVVQDPADVARAIEQALTLAWRKADLAVRSDLALEATVRSFWITPSWTTVCELAVDLRLRDADGAVRWQQTVDSRVQEFQGRFAAESFERVATLALDRFVDAAAAAFGSPAFVAAAAATP